MRKLIATLVLALALLFTPTVKAQTVLLGVSGSDSFNNMSAGVTAGVEIPFHRFEVDLYDIYSPYETHVGLGQGHANIATAGGRFWMTDKFALSGRIEDSGYSVTKVSKTAFYVLSGFTVRHTVLDFPSRINFGYAQQINNGIVNGVETSHLRGGYIGIETRLGCTKNYCFRFFEQLTAGHTLNQGNPVCDGTIGAGNFTTGPYPCPRHGGFGGGVIVGFWFDRSFGEDKF